MYYYTKHCISTNHIITLLNFCLHYLHGEELKTYNKLGLKQQ